MTSALINVKLISSCVIELSSNKHTSHCKCLMARCCLFFFRDWEEEVVKNVYRVVECKHLVSLFGVNDLYSFNDIFALLWTHSKGFDLAIVLHRLHCLKHWLILGYFESFSILSASKTFWALFFLLYNLKIFEDSTEVCLLNRFTCLSCNLAAMQWREQALYKLLLLVAFIETLSSLSFFFLKYLSLRLSKLRAHWSLFQCFLECCWVSDEEAICMTPFLFSLGVHWF